MKTEKLIISAILIFALTNHAYGLGGHHHHNRGYSGGSTTTNNSEGNVVTVQANDSGSNSDGYVLTLQGINGSGSNSEGNVVTVQGLNTTGDSVADPVPEPATMLLLGSGLIGIVAYGRKKFFKK